MSFNRRRFLQTSGAVLWLPVLESLVSPKVFAANQLRNKFIGVFTPNGALMPNGENGNWTWEGALRPLVDLNLKNNTMILRGVYSEGFQDPHWLNTAGFLSSYPLTLAADRPTECGKTLDQFIVGKWGTSSPLKSLHVGWRPMNRDFSADHGSYSDRYLDTLSWRENNRPVSNINSNQELFEKIYSASNQGRRYLQAINERKKSILDGLLSELQSLRAKISGEDRLKLDSYTEGVRQVENGIVQQNSANAACSAPFSKPTAELPYMDHFMLMHKMIAQAFECGVITSATLMYDDGVGDQYLLHPTALHDHHHYAHHGNNAAVMDKLNFINTQHAILVADFVKELKNRNLLGSSLVFWGSNMSDGNTHRTDNLPMVVCGEGSDLKFGQEVGSIANKIRKADVLAEVSGLFGVTETSTFGSGLLAGQGKRIGLSF